MSKKKKSFAHNNVQPMAASKITPKSQVDTKMMSTWLPLALMAVLAVATWFTFSPSFDNDFTNWDDPIYVTENENIQTLDAATVKKQFDPKTNVAGNYHPLTMLTLARDYDKNKAMNPKTGRIEVLAQPFHKTNVLIHVLNTLLVFVFGFLISRKNWSVALIAALAFGLHPLHAESVSWVSGRKDMVYSFFFLLSLISYWLFLQSKNWLMYIAALLFFVGSILGKPAGVVLPVVLVLLDYFYKQPINFKTLLNKIPFFIGAVVLGLLTLKTQSDSEAVAGFENYGFFQRLVFAGYGFYIYIYKFIIPSGFSAFHPYPTSKTVEAVHYLGFFATAAILALVIWRAKKNRYLMLGIGFYAITIGLVLQLYGVGDALWAERYSYMPYVGLGLLLGFGLNSLKESNASRKFFVPAFTVVLLLSGYWAYAAHKQSAVWKNTETLWTQVIEVYDDKVGKAYNNRGLYRKDAGRLEEALQDYNKGLAIDPINHLTYNSRGNVLNLLAKKDQNLAFMRQSESDFTKAIAIRKDHFQSYNARGLNYLDLGEYMKQRSADSTKYFFQKALNDFNSALSINTNYIKGYINRANYYQHVFQWDSASKDYSTYLKYYPADVSIRGARGYTYLRAGKNNEALADLQYALGQDPNNGGYNYLYSYALDQLGRKAEAYKAAVKAQQLGYASDQTYIDKLKRESGN